ncbi:hypothetical protein [Vreelandella neptunia]|uniref:Uncharacterized protein n=1 Tax=Vreelandella neptunia TaxID=115551 RepID=A0ABZ0YTL4_9GAMM|nr:hypothetical protein [Halomonas neptunia]MDN3561668.1 hypothetical protein [Halomonas neptunia]WQH14570.1 hypothetical protein SR894_08535 [Halomonas neptunia]
MSMDQQYTDALKELEAVKAERDEYRNHLAAIAEMTGNGEDIGAAHEGVNALVEDLAGHKRMFVAACETLGEIQQALGNDIVGIEPVLVKELIEERDALAEHVQRITSLVLDLDECEQDSEEMGEAWDTLSGALQSAPATNLARRDSIKQEVAVKDFAREVWEALTKSYRTQKVMPLTMAKHWIERNKPEGHQ